MTETRLLFRIGNNRYITVLLMPPEMRLRRGTGRGETRARARAHTFQTMGGDGGEGEGETNVGGSLMRIHRRRIPFSEDISSLYSPLNQQLPAVLRGRSMLIDIAHSSAYTRHISSAIQTHSRLRTYAYVPSFSLSLSPSLSAAFSFCTCARGCMRRV